MYLSGDRNQVADFLPITSLFQFALRCHTETLCIFLEPACFLPLPPDDIFVENLLLLNHVELYLACLRISSSNTF
ncbi:hypothetical protein F2P81_025552 [Scophthalmus maximus]|uniref:Uncharacterized protein n=1 Tax=Scophthalmus maximus TaxID=52904 RepID=A0A6A4RPS6_SCOMX|nr:hypothetical protein F2P81_025552 [Scophthalmus maximus]